MLVVLTAIIIVVCVYYLFTQGRQPAPAVSTMSDKLRLGSGVGGPEDGDITNDDSDLLTEQSSVSDSTGNNEGAEEGTGSEESQLIDTQSQGDTLEYTEMAIEEPPSFLNSQSDGHVRPSLMQTYLKRLMPSLKNDEDEMDDVFQKKPEARHPRMVNRISSTSDDQSCSTSSGSQSNRKPRKPRKPREPRGRKNDKPIFNWRQKQGGGRNRNTTDDPRGSDGAGHQSSELEESSQADEDDSVSESSASVSTMSSDDVPLGSRRRRPLKHVTITFDNEETAGVLKGVKHEELQIAGVNVKFPVKPYPSQIAVINKLIQGCKKEEHCLLESPTGSGKTLALLCGVLAWQEHFKEEIRRHNAEAAKKAQEQYEIEMASEVESDSTYIPSSEEVQDEKSADCRSKQCGNADEIIEISEDEGDQPQLKKVCRSKSPGSMCQAEASEFDSPIPDEEKMWEEIKQRKLPTIYYGSRTHKQIEQVVRELKKTAYAYKKMTILSSREFTCIQNTDSNKTEVCAKLLDPTKGLGCKYHNENTRNKISSNRALNSFGIHGPWDIEDLVELGKDQSACPYFAARDLMMEADIVFCPYNYLVDPNIRQSMQINLDGQVVILDEAHNIEEMSREVGSLSFREDKITEVLEEAEALCLKRKYDVETYKTIKIYLKNLLQFIKVNNLNMVDKFSETASSDFWTGVQLCELFNMHSLGKGMAKNFQAAAAAAIMDFNTAKEEIAKKQQLATPSLVITPIAKKFLEDLTLALQMMQSEKLANDYRACIIESNVRDFSHVPDNTWVHRGASKRLRTLQMLCMNPAVIFAPLAIAARSVILASGTLSPISSFQSELGTAFAHKLDANHVVPKESVYIRGIPCGPTGVHLKANYTNVNSWNFQDELGRLILDVCKVIPHGVLCFFSSYSMMQKQIDRWKQNSCWDKLEEVKHVLQEPRGSSNLEPVMQQFRETIQYTSEGPRDGKTGALLLAVFRGKVAEGIDFSDNEARCVMAIGIPYAVRKDPSVDMKFNYNNLNCSKGLLKGGEWYAVQAFRALNQALGRCVRHRNDWGAVLLIDQRFLERSSYNYLPKWVKTMWRDNPRYNLTQELEQFVASQVDRTEKAKS